MLFSCTFGLVENSCIFTFDRFKGYNFQLTHLESILKLWVDRFSTYIMIVITVSRYDSEDYQKENGVATDLFCTGVIGHPGYIFLN